MKRSAFMLSAVQSNSGKTTMSMAIMAALTKQGHRVQPFKVGPDYIDPMYHHAATRNYSRNLDSFMLTDDTIRYLFQKNTQNSDIAVIEGVMGLYDGRSGNSMEGSSAHIAQILDLPVILIINGNGMSLSVAAMIKGFRDFSPKTKICGVLLNQIKNESSFLYLKEIIEENCNLPVFGYLPQNEVFTLNNRHLGLYCSDEISDLKHKLDEMAKSIMEHCDLNALIQATQHESGSASKPPLPQKLTEKVTLGVAYDKAFNFYYQDNLDLLTELGAELIYFSPLKDKKLPQVDGIYLGGGYPELYLEELASNDRFREQLFQALDQGMPCYAECGGLIYLGKTMTYQGKTAPLTGYFPFDFAMTDRLQHFGYMTATIPGKTILSGKQELTINGHEFHYTKRIDSCSYPTVYRVTKQRRNKTIFWEEGYAKGNTIGGYPHFHFYSAPDIAKNLLDAAISYRRRGNIT